MTNITVGTSVVTVPLERGCDLVIQNLSSGTVYFGRTSSVTTANGVKIAAGASLAVSDRSGRIPFAYLIGDAASLDVRYDATR